jgi:hypothetical protein
MHDMRTQTQQAEIGERRQRFGWPWKLVGLLGLLVLAGVTPRVLRSNQLRTAPGYGIPPPDTGNILLDLICSVLFQGVHIERRIDPFIRPPIDKYLRDPLSELVTRMINMLRKDEGYQLAEERIQPDEEAHIDDIVKSFTIIMRKLWYPGNFERGGNTKTHGIVRAEFTVRDDLPEHMRRGIFAKPATYKAWVRYSGPGPYVTTDIDDVGFMSMAIKLMGVPGPKLMDDEKFTQDLLCTSAPTFVSPDTRANAQLHHWSMKNAALIYFFNPRDHHLLDTIMQGLWTKTQTSPLEDQYFSCVPYLLGEGQAMQYSFWTRLKTKTPVPRLPFRPPDNYLREAMAATLAKQDVEFDIMLQVQTDPFLQPIENAAVMWPTSVSPRVPAAVLRIPRQAFDSPEQMMFVRKLRFNPYHCLPEHRPLGNVSRARKRMYYELSQVRLKANTLEHYEPTGDETF